MSEARDASARALYEAVLDLHGNYEDCEDCVDIETANPLDAHPCRLHGPEFERTYRAILALEEAFGPCACGHPRQEHEQEDSTACRSCDCHSFKLP